MTPYAPASKESAFLRSRAESTFIRIDRRPASEQFRDRAGSARGLVVRADDSASVSGRHRACVWRHVASFLVVDDDPSTVSGLERLLTFDGHDVTPVTSGADAVTALTNQSFDAVVTDLEMPHVDGHEVVKATRKHQPHACVVVASTLADEKCRDLVDAGACIIADKPFEYEEITKAVTECRARGGPGAHGKCHMRSRPEGHRLVSLRRK